MLAFSQFDFIVRYFFLVLMILILLGLFNGLVFLPVLLVMMGPPAQVIPNDKSDSLPPCTPEPQPPRYRLKPPKQEHHSRSHSSHNGGSGASSHHKVPKRHNSDLSLSTIAEETHSHQDSTHSSSSYDSECSTPRGGDSSVHNSLNGGTSVFLEPHITVETSTVPHHSSSGGSSRCSTPPAGTQVTKVTAKFKMEVQLPVDRPASRRSRRSSSSSKGGGDSSTHSSLTDPLKSSGDNSLASSLSSDGGFSEK